jgi:hypothetical protein
MIFMLKIAYNIGHRQNQHLLHFVSVFLDKKKQRDKGVDNSKSSSNRKTATTAARGYRH